MLNASQIRDLQHQARGYWSNLHNAMDLDYREVDEGPSLTIMVDEEPIETIRPHKAWSKVRTAVNHLIDGELEIKVDSHARSDTARKKGEEIADALRAIHHHATKTAAVDPQQGCVFNAAAMGMGVWFVCADFSRLDSVDARKPSSEDAMDAWRDERDEAFPILIEVEDPRSIFPDPGTYGKRWCMKIERRTVGDIRRNWYGWQPKERDNGEPKTEFDEVEWFEFWSAPGGLGDDDPGSYYYEADGEPIRRYTEDAETGEMVDDGAGPWPHEMGFCPFVIWSAGYGMTHGKPEAVFKGLVRNPRESGIFRAIAKRRTQKDALADKIAWAAYSVPQGYEKNFRIGLGAVNSMPLDQKGDMVEPKPLQAPQIAPIVLSEEASLAADLDEETISTVLSAPAQDNSDVALLYARRVQEAGTALGPLRRNAERAYDEVWKRVGWLLAHHKGFDDEEAFNLVGVNPDGTNYVSKVGRKLFSGTHIYRTKIDPRFPEDQHAKASVGLAQYQAGVIDLEDHHKRYLGTLNPQDASARALAHTVLRQVIAGQIVSPFANFAMSYLTGMLQKDVKASQFIAAQMQAEADVATTLNQPGASNAAATGLQSDYASGNSPLTRPGAPLSEMTKGSATAENQGGY